MFDRVLRAGALCAGAVLLGVMGLIIFDVVMRYVLRIPFLGAYEISEVAMALIVFLALPYCAAIGGHVSVDLLSPWLDRPGARWTNVLVHLAGAGLTALMAYSPRTRPGTRWRGGKAPTCWRCRSGPSSW